MILDEEKFVHGYLTAAHLLGIYSFTFDKLKDLYYLRKLLLLEPYVFVALPLFSGVPITLSFIWLSAYLTSFNINSTLSI